MNIKEFAKKNKKKIIVAAAVGGTVAAYIILKKKCGGSLLTEATQEAGDAVKAKVPPHLPVTPELASLGVDQIENYSGAIELMVDSYELTVEELGEFGKLLTEIPDANITKDCGCWLLVNVAKDTKPVPDAVKAVTEAAEVAG